MPTTSSTACTSRQLPDCRVVVLSASLHLFTAPSLACSRSAQPEEIVASPSHLGSPAGHLSERCRRRVDVRLLLSQCKPCSASGPFFLYDLLGWACSVLTEPALCDACSSQDLPPLCERTLAAVFLFSFVFIVPS